VDGEVGDTKKRTVNLDEDGLVLARGGLDDDTTWVSGEDQKGGLLTWSHRHFLSHGKNDDVMIWKLDSNR